MKKVNDFILLIIIIIAVIAAANDASDADMIIILTLYMGYSTLFRFLER